LAVYPFAVSKLGKWTNDAWIGLAYFALAAIALVTTRFDDGMAYLWVANAMLVTVLGRRRRRDWAPAIAWSAIGSFLATGMIGAGFVLAPPFALANVTEATLAAYILRRTGAGRLPLGSPHWIGRLVLAAGIAGPLAMMAIVAWPLWLQSGLDPIDTTLRGLAAHGFSNLIFIPIFKLFATSASGVWRGHREREEGVVVPLLFIVQLATTLAVFTQPSPALLFLPILVVIAIVFRGSSRWTAWSLLLLVAIGNAATLLGMGPISLHGIGRGGEVQLLQFYLLTAVLTIVPIAAQIRRNQWFAARVSNSEARYRMLADHSGDVIMHSDEWGVVQFVSPSIERVGGYVPSDLIGRPATEIIHPDFHALIRDHYGFALGGDGRDSRFEYRAIRGNGTWGWFESKCRGLSGNGGPRGVISIIRDISERKEREEQLAIAALTDPLTGLPNRRAFRDAATRLTESQDRPGACIALFDIDFFKAVNDRFGHDAGDEVLQSFAMSARLHLRDGDTLARFGGEEFALLLPGTAGADAIALCERVRAAVASSVCLTAAGPVRFTISGGVAALGEEGLDAALKRADTALYEAKDQGRDRLMRAAA
jgi:diguanylate cyclase (GGDEF)-like protein/PAS domain S-box-containing protein